MRSLPVIQSLEVRSYVWLKYMEPNTSQCYNEFDPRTVWLKSISHNYIIYHYCDSYPMLGPGFFNTKTKHDNGQCSQAFNSIPRHSSAASAHVVHGSQLFYAFLASQPSPLLPSALWSAQFAGCLSIPPQSPAAGHHRIGDTTILRYV